MDSQDTAAPRRRRQFWASGMRPYGFEGPDPDEDDPNDPTNPIFERLNELLYAKEDTPANKAEFNALFDQVFELVFGPRSPRPKRVESDDEDEEEDEEEVMDMISPQVVETVNEEEVGAPAMEPKSTLAEEDEDDWIQGMVDWIMEQNKE